MVYIYIYEGSSENPLRVGNRGGVRSRGEESNTVELASVILTNFTVVLQSVFTPGPGLNERRVSLPASTALHRFGKFVYGSGCFLGLRLRKSFCIFGSSGPGILKFRGSVVLRSATLPRTRQDRNEDDICRAFVKWKGVNVSNYFKSITENDENHDEFMRERQKYIDERNASSDGRASRPNEAVLAKSQRAVSSARVYGGCFWPKEVWKRCGKPWIENRAFDTICVKGKKIEGYLMDIWMCSTAIRIPRRPSKLLITFLPIAALCRETWRRLPPTCLESADPPIELGSIGCLFTRWIGWLVLLLLAFLVKSYHVRAHASWGGPGGWVLRVPGRPRGES